MSSRRLFRRSKTSSDRCSIGGNYRSTFPNYPIGYDCSELWVISAPRCRFVLIIGECERSVGTQCGKEKTTIQNNWLRMRIFSGNYEFSNHSMQTIDNLLFLHLSPPVNGATPSRRCSEHCLIITLSFSIFAVADWLKTCQIDDPGFEECSKESIQGLFKQLAVGKADICVSASNGR